MTLARIVVAANWVILFAAFGILWRRAKEGRIEQSNFTDYALAHHQQAPRDTRVHLVESTAPPAGVGEPGVPPMAPAICNAIFAATGRRIRELPIRRVTMTS